MKAWDGKDLKGRWLVTRKIDGVQVIVKNGRPLSRKGKPLYNLPPLMDGKYEAYLGSFKQTIEVVRASVSERKPARRSQVFNLEPAMDDRLRLSIITDPTASWIKDERDKQISLGFEGLVLRSMDVEPRWLKVKKSMTVDVRVTGYQPGTGKHLGRLGALITTHGKVGTGFSDAERELYRRRSLVGKIIEVECMEITAAGKMRKPRFKRMRPDKRKESLE